MNTENTCKIYVCDINYDARSLYKCLNAKWTTQHQAAMAEDEFNSLPSNLVISFDGFTEWDNHKRVLADWSLPYMIRDDIFRQTGWRIVSFDIAAISVNDKFVTYNNDMTYEFKQRRTDTGMTESDEDEVVNRNEMLAIDSDISED